MTQITIAKTVNPPNISVNNAVGLYVNTLGLAGTVGDDNIVHSIHQGFVRVVNLSNNYTVKINDWGTVFVCDNGVTKIDLDPSCVPGFTVTVSNTGNHAITIDAKTAAIQTFSTVTLPPKQSVMYVKIDVQNWYEIATGGYVNKIADNAVTAQTVVDGAITAGKIADSAITASKLAPGSITADKLSPNFFNATQASLI